MTASTPINELLEYPISLSIYELEDWLDKYEVFLIFCIKKSKCRKWSNCLKSGENPFPCACPTREEDCIFIETYYELRDFYEITKSLKPYEDAVLDFQTLDKDSAGIKEWLNTYNEVYETVYWCDGNISIVLLKDPLKMLHVKVDCPAIILDFRFLYHETNIKQRNVLKFLKVFPINENLKTLEKRIRYINTTNINGSKNDIYRDILDNFEEFYEQESISKTLLFYNHDMLSKVEYEFDISAYNHLFTEINKELPEGIKLIEDPLSIPKKAFCKYKDVAIELIQQDNETMKLVVSDYNEFYSE